MTTVARFLARWPSGALDRQELPLAIASEFATQLRAVGCVIVWAPLQKVEPVTPPTGPTKRERRKAEREQRRQLAELGVPA